MRSYTLSASSETSGTMLCDISDNQCCKSEISKQIVISVYPLQKNREKHSLSGFNVPHLGYRWWNTCCNGARVIVGGETPVMDQIGSLYLYAKQKCNNYFCASYKSENALHYLHLGGIILLSHKSKYSEGTGILFRSTIPFCTSVCEFGKNANSFTMDVRCSTC